MAEYFLPKTSWNKTILEILSGEVGLPGIAKQMNIFEQYGKFQIELDGQAIKYIFGTDKEYILLPNFRLKYFLRSLGHANNPIVSIGTAEVLKFTNPAGAITWYLSSGIGEFIKLVENNNGSLDRIYELLRDYGELGPKGILQPELDKQPVRYEPLFTENGFLNQRIRAYGHDNHLDLGSHSTTLQARLNNLSNDYSSLESPYTWITDTKINSLQVWGREKFLVPISIVVPCYNSEKHIDYLLRALQSQRIPTAYKSQIQVILIDDASTTPLSTFVQKEKFDFEIDIVRSENNRGPGESRNLGLALVRNKYTLFLDSDTLLSQNYILDYVSRIQLIPNALLTSFRKRITLEDKILSSIDKGLAPNHNTDDSRIINYSRADQVGWSPKDIRDNVKVEILEDTNYFKTLGRGSVLGIYDLPAVVSGHNIFVSTEVARKVGGFSRDFKGWGFEDTHFGAKVIANGNYIIPVVSSSVYHIGFGPREKNLAKKIAEVRQNYETYQRLLQEKWT